MMHRITTAGLFVTVVLLGWGATARADDKDKKDHIAHGHVVKVADGSMTVVGEDKKEATHAVAKDAKITIDGKDAKLADLKPHTHVKCTMKEVEGKHVVTQIEADTKK